MEHRRVLEELVRGREFANQLRQVINEKDESTPFAKTLVNNVLRSFTNTLFLFNKYPSYQLSHMQQVTPTKSEDSQKSCKSFTSIHRRGCYNRKRNTPEWEKVSKAPIVDGHQWRKYGQKAILKAKYSRNYYRCTHKYDQNCQATKQVQRIQEESPLYKTIYFGHHTCNHLLNSEIIFDSSNSPHDTSILLSLNHTFPTPTKQECPFLSHSISFNPTLSVNKEEVTPSSSSNDYLLSPEPTLDDSSRHNNFTALAPNQWDAMCDSVDLDDVDLLLDFDD